MKTNGWRIISLEASDIYKQIKSNGEEVGYELPDKKDFTYFVDNVDKTEYFETFFREYYTNLKLEFPDKIVSKDLAEIGQKELYEVRS